MKKWNTAKIRAAKGSHKLACLTAYDYAFAKLADSAGVHIILVGDSLGMTTLGYPTTIPVTMDDMLHHTAAVVRGTQEALVIADMPFLSYQISVQEALRNAGRFLQEAGADGVKIEGGTIRRSCVEALTGNGIPVLGHIGLLPQSIKTLGEYKVQGRTRAAVNALLEDAKDLAEAGAFAIVLECVPPDVAALVTAAVPVPVIGIGSGSACDGQVLVMNDLLGLSESPPAKFVKQYATLAPQIKAAFTSYVADVEAGEYPASEHFYSPAQPKSGS